MMGGRSGINGKCSDSRNRVVAGGRWLPRALIGFIVLWLAGCGSGRNEARQVIPPAEWVEGWSPDVAPLDAARTRDLTKVCRPTQQRRQRPTLLMAERRGRFDTLYFGPTAPSLDDVGVCVVSRRGPVGTVTAVEMGGGTGSPSPRGLQPNDVTQLYGGFGDSDVFVMYGFAGRNVKCVLLTWDNGWAEALAGDGRYAAWIPVMVGGGLDIGVVRARAQAPEDCAIDGV